MRKDYKTIKEVVGPLMLVDCVENVKYDELVEIHEKDGSVRLGKVLEAKENKRGRITDFRIQSAVFGARSGAFRFPRNHRACI